MTTTTTGALEANLARTAVEVVIPDDHGKLLDITTPWRGVNDATLTLLREIHHRYPNWAQTLTDLHRRAMNDFHYHDGCPRGGEAIRIVCDLYATVVEHAPDTIAADGVRLWLTYLDHVVAASQAHRERNLVIAGEAVQRIAPALADPDVAAAATPGLRRLGRTTLGGPGHEPDTAEAVLALLAGTLDIVLTAWLARPDPATWKAESDTPTLTADELRPVDTPGAAWPAPRTSDRMLLVTHAALQSALDRLRAMRPPLRVHAEALLAIPDQATIVRSYLAVAEDLGRRPDGGRIAAIGWLLNVLGHPDLAAAHETALRDITRAVAQLMADPAADRAGVLRSVFTMLRTHEFPYPHTVLHLVTKIGTEALRQCDADLAQTLVDEVLCMDFEYPGFTGFSDEWALRANPAHVEAIRTYLNLIEVNPIAARPLLAALVAHIQLGGVSIPDSALLQRDVSRLLGAPIEPVYVELTHLLRLLPVHFAEIGSEGRLRDVSTRIDEAVGRRDPLCHFLRKQAHVECNAHLIDFVEEIGRYWATGVTAGLRDYLPRAIFEGLDPDAADVAGIHAIFASLVERHGTIPRVFSIDPGTVRDAIADLGAGDPVDRERAALLIEMWHEIRRKYALDHEDILPRLQAFRTLRSDLVTTLGKQLAAREHQGALESTLEILEALQSVVATPGDVNAVEDIYFKRHIAVGIPSMYGSYREDRLEAAGLSLRLGSLAAALIEHVVAVERLPDESHTRLRTVAGWLHLLHRGARVEGFRAQGLGHTLAMLDEALERSGTTDDQLLTIVHLLGRNLEVTIRARILDPYETPVRRVVARMIERGLLLRHPGDVETSALRHSEGLLRDLIAGSFALPRLDALISQMIRELGERVHAHSPAAPTPVPAPDLTHAVTPVATAAPDLGIVALGGKAFMLRQLHRLGLLVPHAFVLTTDVFSARSRFAAGTTGRSALEARLREEVRELEHAAGARFGDPGRPLLLSVRGGAPLSMPGMLSTFLNVGMNPAVARGVAAIRGEWAAWDSYRRFVQSWGMAHGVARDAFDEVIAHAKRRLGVAHKAHLPAGAMHALALDYRRLVQDSGVTVEDDPYRQLARCIDLVHDSWDEDAARLYRQELHISDAWGTAVIVQAMVFGNLDTTSGSGVLLTDQPERSADVVSLSGDFAIQSQGDDVVGGLVETHPITELQRRREARATGRSLEKDFPAIYRTLLRVARTLVAEQGMNHQEIEFTFESPDPSDLYLLQTRDTVVSTRGEIPAFVPSAALEAARVAHGIGVSGGAMSGRIACTMTQIEDVRTRFPGVPVILLRPDTVPDDIGLVLASDGMLTALGGATSHAAVAAKRLGKTCVVGCRALDVDEHAGRATLAGRVLSAGDELSISGLDGTVYRDAHPAAMVGVEGGHRW